MAEGQFGKNSIVMKATDSNMAAKFEISPSNSAKEKPPKSTRRSFIVSRYAVAALSSLGGFLTYALRVHFNVALVAMVNHTAVTASYPHNLATYNETSVVQLTSAPSTDQCGYDPNAQNYDNSTTTRVKDGELIWSPSTQGLVLGAFYYGYAATQIIGGRVGELIGAKWVCGTGVLGAALMSLLTPYAARLHVGAVIAIRVITGLAQGMIFPAFFPLFARWMPQQERSTMIAVLNAGTNAGNIISVPFAAYLCEHGFAGGWPSVFYVYGLIGCVWFLFWTCFVHNTPEEHPGISETELSFILHNRLPVSTEKKKPPVPWRKILMSKPVWAITIARACGTWGFTTLITKLPAYLQFVLHFPMQKTGLVISLVYASQCLALAAVGVLADYCTTHIRRYSLTTIRKGFETITLVGPAICLALIPLAGCNYYVVCALIILNQGIYGFLSGGHDPAVLEIAPDFSGTVFGFTNTISGATGILSPVVAGFLIDKDQGSASNWMLVFFTASGIYVFGAIVFLLWGSAEIQEWGEVKKPGISSSAVQKKNAERIGIPPIEATVIKPLSETVVVPKDIHVTITESTKGDVQE